MRLFINLLGNEPKNVNGYLRNLNTNLEIR
jgi:hypothetical protein